MILKAVVGRWVGQLIVRGRTKDGVEINHDDAIGVIFSFTQYCQQTIIIDDDDDDKSADSAVTKKRENNSNLCSPESRRALLKTKASPSSSVCKIRMEYWGG